MTARYQATSNESDEYPMCRRFNSLDEAREWAKEHAVYGATVWIDLDLEPVEVWKAGKVAG